MSQFTGIHHVYMNLPYNSVYFNSLPERTVLQRTEIPTLCTLLSIPLLHFELELENVHYSQTLWWNIPVLHFEFELDDVHHSQE